jgi:hypothetical protein
MVEEMVQVGLALVEAVASVLEKVLVEGKVDEAMTVVTEEVMEYLVAVMVPAGMEVVVVVVMARVDSGSEGVVED